MASVQNAAIIIAWGGYWPDYWSTCVAGRQWSDAFCKLKDYQEGGGVTHLSDLDVRLMLINGITSNFQLKNLMIKCNTHFLVELAVCSFSFLQGLQNSASSMRDQHGPRYADPESKYRVRSKPYEDSCIVVWTRKSHFQ